jgi:hypothetical protein
MAAACPWPRGRSSDMERRQSQPPCGFFYWPTLEKRLTKGLTWLEIPRRAGEDSSLTEDWIAFEYSLSVIAHECSEIRRTWMRVRRGGPAKDRDGNEPALPEIVQSIGECLHQASRIVNLMYAALGAMGDSDFFWKAVLPRPDPGGAAKAPSRGRRAGVLDSSRRKGTKANAKADEQGRSRHPATRLVSPQERRRVRRTAAGVARAAANLTRRTHALALDPTPRTLAALLRSVATFVGPATECLCAVYGVEGQRARQRSRRTR